MTRIWNGISKLKACLQVYMAAVFICLLLAETANAASAELADIDLDGEADEVHVETDFYSGVIDLTRNGQFNRLLYKPTDTNFSGAQYFIRYYYPGNDWIKPGDPETGFHSTNNQQKLTMRMLMGGKVEQVDEKTVRVTVEGYCPDIFGADWFSDLFSRRVITFRDGQRTIEFEYSITNNNDQARPIFIVMDHGIDCRYQKAEGYAPQPYGTSMLDNSSHGSKYMELEHPQANWWGILKRNGTGAVETFEGTWIKRGYIHGKANAGLGLHQDLNPVIIKPGKTQTWKYTLSGLHGLNSLNGAVPGMIVGLEFCEEAKPAAWQAKETKPGSSMPVTARLLSDADRSVSVEMRQIDGDTNKEIASQTVSVKLRAHEPALATFKPVTIAPGFNVFKLRILEGDKELIGCYESFDASGKGRKWRPEDVNPLPKKGNNVVWKERTEDTKRPEPEVDLSVTTEHVAWAKPSAAGTAKLLVSLPYNNCEAHIRELMERGDYELIMARNGNDLPGKLKDCDLAFIAAIDINKGKKAVANRNAILEAARRGAGIVVCGNPKRELYHLNRALTKDGTKEMPAIVKAPQACNATGSMGAQCFTLGKGRIVMIPRSAKGYRDSLEPVINNASPSYPVKKKGTSINWGIYRGFEYSYQTIIGLLEWAGKRSTEVTCGEMGLEGPADKRRLVMPLSAAEGQKLTGTLKVVLRNLFNEVVAEGEGDVTAGTVELGSIPAGGHVAEWRLINTEGKVQAFGSQLVSLDSNDKVNVSLDHKNASYRVGDCVTATVSAKASFANAKAAYSVIDSYGREVAKGSVALDAQGKGEIALPVLRNCTELHDLWVSLMDGNRTAAKTVETFYLFPKTNPMDNDFFVVAWGPMKTGDTAQRQIGARSAREAGMDYNHLTGDGAGNRDICYRSNGRLYSLLSKNFNFKRFKWDDKTKSYTPSFAPDKERAATMKADWQKRVSDAHAVGGAFYFGLDDERGMGWDMSEESIRQFRLWLADKYKTVQALNKSWATAYTSFDEVTGAEKSPEFGPEANLAADLDRKTFHKYIWGHWYMRMPGLWAQEAVPGASAGVAGTYGFNYDPLYAFGPWFNHTNYYPDGYKSEVYRSLGLDNFEAGPYTGYQMMYNAPGATHTQRSMPWRIVFQGGMHLSYWELQTSQKAGNYAILRNDGTPSPGYRDLARDEWPDLKGGVGKLIIDREFVDSKIGLMNGARYGEPAKCVIEDLQRQHHIYLQSEIENGKLEKDGVKVLLMPALRIVSDKLLAAIERFVSKGGQLVLLLEEKNRRPGEMDNQGHLRKNKDVFSRLCGVDLSQLRRHAGRGTVKAEGAAKGIPGIDQGMLRPAVAGLTVTDAEVLARADVRGTEVLVWTRRKHGAGTVYLLNGSLRDYKVTQTGGVAGEVFTTASGPERIKRVLQGVYRAAIDAAEIPALFTVKQSSGATFMGECYRFETKGEKNGPVVFGFIPSVTGEATVTLPAAAHLYDVRERRYIGETATIKASLKASHAKVWAALPYKVDGVRIESVPAEIKPGSLIKVKASVQADGKTITFAHTVRLLLQRKNGDAWVDLPAHSINLSAVPATFERELPLAYNTKPGKYRILVRDILSGVEGTREFEVR